MSKPVYVWDRVVRLFHWSLVICFGANALLTDPEKPLHHYIGYTVAGLIVLRLVWGLVGSRYARFASFLPNPATAIGHLGEIATGRRHAHVGHSPLGALMIYNLLLTFVVIAGSGYAQTTLMFFGVKWVKEVHEIAVTWAEIAVVAHIAAVVLESRRLGINLARSMVTGVKDMPQG